jgi:hypothetical protein
MNRKTKRLILSKETVQNLEEGQLTAVGGARTGTCSAVDACPSRLCSAVDACPSRLCPSIALAC